MSDDEHRYTHQTVGLSFTITDTPEVEPTKWQRTKARVRRFFGLHVPYEYMTPAEREAFQNMLARRIDATREHLAAHALYAGCDVDACSRAEWERTVAAGNAMLTRMTST